MEYADVIIIGAGVSGLVAAYELEKKGLSPLILESADVPGGRLKSDRIDGFLLDHGFQVLLTAYPEANRYLNFAQLNLGNFEAGAIVYAPDGKFKLADPLKNPSQLLPMLFSGIGNISDKIRVLQLINQLKSTEDKNFFEADNQSTLQFLQNYGFSPKIINRFFAPFFKGIFLEDKLETSSRLFQFIFKMFSTGTAALPGDGIQAIPKQLVGKLKRTTIRLNEKVTEISSGGLQTTSGEYKTDDLIISTYPDLLLPGLRSQSQSYNDTLCLYFRTNKRVYKTSHLGLSAGKNLINNFCYPNAIHEEFASSDQNLLSISVVNVPDSPLSETIKQVRAEWEKLTGQNPSELEFLKQYRLRQALPVVELMAYSMPETAVKVQDHIYLAGDYLLYGSLNAAMTSGRTAANAVLAGRNMPG